MAGGEQLRAAHVDQHEIGAGLERFVHVAAVGLDAEPALEMRERGGGVGKAGFGHEGGHGWLLWVASRSRLDASRRNPELAGMPKSGNIRPCRTPPLVVTLASDRLAMFEFGIAAEFFALARPELDFVPYRFAVAAADPPPLRGLGGIRVDVDGGLELLRDANLIVVPGWRDLDETPRPEITRALRDAVARGARVVSICSGVFLLAHAGLLDGRRATTHWRHTERLARLFPNDPGRARRALCRRRQRDDLGRLGRRHRSAAASGAQGLRAARRQHVRAPHGGAAASRRRAVAIRRAADRGAHQRPHRERRRLDGGQSRAKRSPSRRWPTAPR